MESISRGCVSGTVIKVILESYNMNIIDYDCLASTKIPLHASVPKSPVKNIPIKCVYKYKL